MPWFGLFAGGLAISFVLTLMVRRAAAAADLLDRTEESRKIHAIPVPRLGGLGILAGVYGSLLIAAFLDPALREHLLAQGGSVAALAAGGLVIAALGAYDDVWGANARQKFAVQWAIALLLYVAGFRILHVENPFGPNIALGWLSLPVTLLWIVGVTNAVNLVDGLDGLAAGVAVAAAAALAAIGAQAGNACAVPIAIATIGSVLGFLVFNFNPASIFMGDTGSLFLGLLLSVLGLAPHSGTRATPLVAIAVVLAIPVADTLLAMARRFACGAPLFRADRRHLHHRLLDKGLSQREAVVALWAGAGLLAAAGLHVGSPGASAAARALVLALVILAGGLALAHAGMFEFLRDAARERSLRDRRHEPALETAAGSSPMGAGELAAPRIDVLGYGVTCSTPDACAESVLRWIRDGERCRWVACINPHSYVVARTDRRFREALMSADSLLPDGTGIVLASRLLKRPLARRVTGSDLFHGVMEAVDRQGGARVFFLGSTDETLAIIREKVRAEFPGATVAGTYSPPFRAEFTVHDTETMIDAINAARADVLWVGMTAPKQEVWLHENLDRLDVKVAGAIGAAFDFYAGRVRRSPRVFQQLGLEWLPRLLREPRRLWKRTFVSAPVFLWDTAWYAVSSERASLRERDGASRPRATPGSPPSLAARGRAHARAHPGGAYPASASASSAAGPWREGGAQRPL